MAPTHLTRWTLIAILGLVPAGLLAPGARAADEEAALRKQALKLNDVTGTDQQQAAYKALIGNPANTKRLLTLAAKIAKEKEKDQPFQINASFILARAAQALKDYEISEQFYHIFEKQAVELGSLDKIAQSYSGLTGLYYETKKYEKCEQLCRDFFGQNVPEELNTDQVKNTKVVLIRRYIMALTKDGKSDEAMKVLDKFLDGNKDSWFFNELKGWVLREDGKYDEAVKVYQDILTKIKDDKDLTREEKRETGDEVRYILSSVYVENKQIDKAAEQLKLLLANDPDNATYNNDLGFIWADNDMKLDESEKLIRKALVEDKKKRHKDNPDIKPEEDKDNAAYLDSMGWVLYKQKKYDEAKKYLQQAVELPEGQHIEIFDHLGDNWMALGNKAKAIEAWKKGIEHPNDNKRDKERGVEMKKKIKANE